MKLPRPMSHHRLDGEALVDEGLLLPGVTRREERGKDVECVAEERGHRGMGSMPRVTLQKRALRIPLPSSLLLTGKTHYR